jgi:hypothetical protein
MMVNSLPAGLAAPQQIPQTSTHAIVAAVINPAGQGILPLNSASSELLSAFECPVCLGFYFILVTYIKKSGVYENLALTTFV